MAIPIGTLFSSLSTFGGVMVRKLMIGVDVLLYLALLAMFIAWDAPLWAWMVFAGCSVAIFMAYWLSRKDYLRKAYSGRVLERRHDLPHVHEPEEDGNDTADRPQPQHIPEAWWLYVKNHRGQELWVEVAEPDYYDHPRGAWYRLS